MKHLTLGQHFGENKNSVKLKDLIINEARIDSSDEVPWHYHENAYFLYNVRGSFLEINKKDKIECTPGSLLYHNWQEAHCNQNISNNANYFHIEIEKAWFDKQNIDQNIIQGSKNIQQPEIKAIFQKIYGELNTQDKFTPISIDGLLLQAFSLILRADNAVSYHLQPKWVNDIKELLTESNVDHLDLSLLAKEIGISPVHLSRSFPKYFNSTLGDRIRSLKVEKARNLLSTGNASNSEIAYSCGFSDESHFIKSFKKQLGLTPGDYRRQILGHSH